jgi:hypothetical protein
LRFVYNSVVAVEAHQAAPTFAMGVKHLWQIVGPVGKPVQLESLTHRRLAIGALLSTFPFFIFF